MKRYFHRTSRRPSSNGGFTLVELVIGIAAFSIICGGLLCLLLTTLRIEKSVAQNTERRETIRIISTFLQNVAQEGTIEANGTDLKCRKTGATVFSTVLTYDSSTNELKAGENTLLKNISSVSFSLMADNLMVKVELTVDGEDYSICVQCPLNEKTP